MRLAVKLLLGWFVASSFVIGLWQAVFPASFHADFPGMGHHWVGPDGPYNEHLLRERDASEPASRPLAASTSS